MTVNDIRIKITLEHPTIPNLCRIDEIWLLQGEKDATRDVTSDITAYVTSTGWKAKEIKIIDPMETMLEGMGIL
jgi:hypothetical protein